MTARDASCWMIERRWGLALIFAILLQAASSIWWAADLSARVRAIEIEQARQQSAMERLAAIETDVRWIRQTLDRKGR
ncbi:hypothetical protein [Nitratidesulfovibrio sp. 1201_IL3209]|uniref:hypothetical protein n=1 Tax=Nitratidesulfovibrio sp. 1201_IL3209 TaxID=3084053 RepID=UPI002FD9EC90